MIIIAYVNTYVNKNLLQNLFHHNLLPAAPPHYPEYSYSKEALSVSNSRMVRPILRKR